jgi:hypothetical protein
MNYSLFILSIFLGVIITSCGGLDPTKEPIIPATQKPLVEGTIHFAGGKTAWPPKDSALEIRVVFFQKYPPDTNLVLAISTGEAFFTDTIQRFSDSSSFRLRRDEVNKALPLEFPYVVVALRFGGNFFTDWRAVGVYSVENDQSQPLKITVDTINTVKLQIPVDFTNPPPQPF